MAKSRGRPKGSGKAEDEPLVREAVRAFQRGEYRSPRAAAIEFSGRLPGGIDANFDRLYSKILSRSKEEPEAEDEDEVIDEGLINLAVELAGESPEVKISRLTRFFRIIVENTLVVDGVIQSLRSEGLVLTPDLMRHLMKIHLYIVLNEREMAGYDEKVKARKRRRYRSIGPTRNKKPAE